MDPNDPSQPASAKPVKKPSEEESSGLARAGRRAVARVAAIIGGLVLMVLGVGLGVTMVLLPIGIPVALVGLLLFLTGLYGPSMSDW